MAKVKKLLGFLSLVLVFSLVTPSFTGVVGTGVVVQAATFKLNRSSLNMKVKDKKTLKVSGLGKKYKVTWKSSRSAVASVSKSGVVTAKSAGVAKISAVVKDGKKTKKTLSCNVNVTQPLGQLQRSLNVTKQTVGVGFQFQLNVVDADVYDTIEYWSDNNDIAYVNPHTGVVEGIEVGETFIIARVVSSDKLSIATLKCKVTVEDEKYARGLNFYSNSVERFLSFTLQVTNASDVDYVEYFSSDESIVQVKNTGTIYADVIGVNIGVAYVTVRIKKEGNEVEEKNCRVVVKDYNKKRSLASAADTVKAKDSTAILVNTTPVDKITYTSNDTKVATVAENGVVTGVGAGTTTIEVLITFPDEDTLTLNYTITVVKEK